MNRLGHNIDSALDHIYDNIFTFKHLGRLLKSPLGKAGMIGGLAYGASQHPALLATGAVGAAGFLASAFAKRIHPVLGPLGIMGISSLLGPGAFAGAAIGAAPSLIKSVARGMFKGFTQGGVSAGIGLGRMGVNFAQGAWSGLKGVERGARTVFANGSWFPDWSNKSLNIIQRSAPNLSIGRRLMGLGLVAGVGAAWGEAISPKAPPPTVYFDGLHTRHINDMGAGGDYGLNILGKNSMLNHRLAMSGVSAADDIAFAGLRSVIR